MEGTTFGVDLPNIGEKSLGLLSQMTEVVNLYGGRVYPAKDAAMLSDDFKGFYPNWTKIEKLRDRGFCSDFWRRVVHVL